MRVTLKFHVIENWTTSGKSSMEHKNEGLEDDFPLQMGDL